MELDTSLLHSKPRPTLVKAALKLFMKAAPTILSYIFQMGIEMINLLFIGHIDKYRMDAVGLGNMWANITGVGIGWGLEHFTLCAHRLPGTKTRAWWEFGSSEV
jgi:Na+-driven multidrug efflux pump